LNHNLVGYCVDCSRSRAFFGPRRPCGLLEAMRHLQIDLVLSDVLNSGLVEHASSTSIGTVDPGF